MPTTGQVFVLLTNPASVGDTYQAAGTIASYTPSVATSIVNSGAATYLNGANGGNYDGDGFAKHGGSSTNLTGTTPVTLSLLDLTVNSTTSTGDTVFATWNKITLVAGTADLTVAPGGSNPATLGLAGTTPTLTVPAGSSVTLNNRTGTVIDGTHKSITITPTAGGSFGLAVAGA